MKKALIGAALAVAAVALAPQAGATPFDDQAAKHDALLFCTEVSYNPTPLGVKGALTHMWVNGVEPETAADIIIDGLATYCPEYAPVVQTFFDSLPAVSA